MTCACEGQSHSYFYCVYLRDSCVVMSAVIRTHSKSNLCQQWSTPGTCRLKLSVSRQSVQQVTVMFSIYFLLNRIVIMWGKYLCFQGLKWQLLTVPSIPYIWFMVQVIFLQCHQHQPWTRTNWRPPVLKWSPGVRSLLFTSVWRTWSKHGQNVYDLLTWLFSNPLCSMRPVIWQFQNAVQRTQDRIWKMGEKVTAGCQWQRDRPPVSCVNMLENMPPIQQWTFRCCEDGRYGRRSQNPIGWSSCE